MKVNIKSNFIIIIIIFMLFSSLSVSYAEESLTIPNWKIESQLRANGDLSIVEDITFRFNDKFNGVFREIVLDKTSGIQNIKVAELTDSGEIQYLKVDAAKKGDHGVFLVKEDSNVNSVQIFSPSRNEEKTFRISYTVKDVAIRHNDIGELYYKFLGNENKTPIGSITVEIKLPQSDINDEVKIFAHGPLNGKIIRKTNNLVYMQVTDVPPNTYVEGRILFPKDFISDSTNIVNKNSYKNILEEEASFQRKIEEKSALDEAITKTLGYISLIVSIVEVLIFILFLIIFRRDKDINESIVGSQIPEDCTPALAAYLTTMVIDTNTIMATIIDLYRKGHIRIDNGEELTNKGKKIKDFTITRVSEDDADLLSHERYFLAWILDEIGDGKSVTTKDIELYSKESNTRFLSAYSDWQKKIKEDAINKGYFEKGKGRYAALLIVFSSITLLVSIVSLIFESILGLTLLVSSILLLICGISLIYRKSDYGYIQYKKWLEFKRYMINAKRQAKITDFSSYPLDITLIYALSLGVDKRILKKFDIETVSTSSDYLYSNGWLYWYIVFANDKNNSFKKSIDNSFGSASSSTGSGGGFSGGGGGGAGGGGAGGF